MFRMGRLMVQKKLFALLVFDGDESFESLRALLKSQAIEVWSSRTRAETARLLEQTHPDLIFTATQLADGTWRIMPKAIPNSKAALALSAVGSSFATLSKFDPASDKFRWQLKTP